MCSSRRVWGGPLLAAALVGPVAVAPAPPEPSGRGEAWRTVEEIADHLSAGEPDAAQASGRALVERCGGAAACAAAAQAGRALLLDSTDDPDAVGAVESLLARPADGAGPEARIWGLLLRAGAGAGTRSPAETAADLDEALALARALGTPHLLARALRSRGLAEASFGRWREAAGHFEEAARVRQALGDPSREARDEASRGVALRQAGAIPQALAALQRSCDLDDAGGCEALAELQARQAGDESALRSAAKACRLGRGPSCHRAALGSPPGARRRDLLEQACSLGVDLACAALGQDLVEALNGPGDAARGAGLAERACEAGAPQACAWLVQAASPGGALPASPARAARWAERGCEGGDADLCRIAATLLERGGEGHAPARAAAARRREQALRQEACLHGGGEGCARLAELLGVDAHVVDRARAAATACARGERGACVTLGVKYALGDGVGADADLARAAWRRACGLGERKACAYSP